MIKVMTGPMFSGKSTKVIEEFGKIINIVEQPLNILCFKPSKDTRDLTFIRCRSNDIKIESIVIDKFDDILKYINKYTKYVFIDEIQFLDGNYKVIQKLSIENNIDFILSGLSLDSKQNPFGKMPEILSIADNVIHLYADCECGSEALYTYGKNEICEDYIPVCRDCLLKYKSMERRIEVEEEIKNIKESAIKLIKKYNVQDIYIDIDENIEGEKSVRVNVEV